MSHANKVKSILDAIRRQHPSWSVESESLIVVEDWAGDGATYIFWEEGPYQWSYLFPGGGIDEEFGTQTKSVETPGCVPGDDYDSSTSYSLVVYA